MLFLAADLIHTMRKPTSSTVHTRFRTFTNLCLRQKVRKTNLFVRKCNSDPGAANPLTRFKENKLHYVKSTLNKKLERRMLLM